MVLVAKAMITKVKVSLAIGNAEVSLSHATAIGHTPQGAIGVKGNYLAPGRHADDI